MKVAGKWRYVYRAIDQFGQVIDVCITPQRDAKAAWRFFERAFNTTKVMPVEVNTHRAATYPVVLEELLPRGLAPHRAARQQPDRGRSGPPEGTAATDARTQAGP